MNTRFVGIKELRSNMAKITKQAQKKKQRLIVLRKNEPIFELKPLSKDEIFSEKFMRDVEEGLEDIRKGRVYTREEVEKELGL